MLVSQWNGKTGDNGCKDIQKLGGTIELVGLVDESEEALVHCLSDHLSSWHKLGIQLVENVLEVVSLHRLFGIEKLEELLDKLRRNVHLEGLDFDSFVNN